MREIKFRAWDGENNRMIYSGHTTTDFIFGGMGDGVYEKGKLTLDLFDNLMQYTGLKDKNGKEIYEGDIIALYGFKQKEEVEIERDVVRWNEEEAGFWVGCAKSYDQDNPKILTNIVIVGNIHRNPELLNEN
jgi:uncharacterized phage protein (TIGR01671 family)